jgi:hypothetical protein
LSQLSALDGRTAINAMVVPNGTSRASGAATSNPGDYALISHVSTFTLPTGGTWFVIAYQRVSSNATFDTTAIFGPNAGGTVLNATSGRTLIGVAWRIV